MVGGQMHRRISDRILDPLTTTALALENSDGTIAIFCSSDLGNIAPGIVHDVRQRLAIVCPDVPPETVIMNATHTHSAPVPIDGVYKHPGGDEVMTVPEWLEFLCQNMADCIAAAWNSRAPGRIGHALGHAITAHNRRVVYADGRAQMYGRTDGDDFRKFESGEDHGVDMLFTYDADDKLQGVMVGIACPSQLSEAEMFISADFWHDARVEMRERIQGDLFILPFCQSAGDLSPRSFVTSRQEERMLKLSGRTRRQELAHRITNAVADAVPLAAKNIAATDILNHDIHNLRLPGRVISEKDCEFTRSNMERFRKQNISEDNLSTWLDRQQAILDRFESGEASPDYTVELHVVRIGDFAVATNPFELYVEYGIQIKARSKAPQTATMQLCSCIDGDRGGGYLPTANAIEGGHYSAEPASNLVGPEGGQILVEETLTRINAMFES
jgi:hypothetical protein